MTVNGDWQNWPTSEELLDQEVDANEAWGDAVRQLRESPTDASLQQAVAETRAAYDAVKEQEGRFKGSLAWFKASLEEPDHRV